MALRGRLDTGRRVGKRDRGIADYAWKARVLRKTETRDDLGGLEESWEELGSSWALVEALSASQQFFSGQVVGEATHRIRLKHDVAGGVSVHDRVVVTPGGQEWDVTSVHRVPQIREVEVLVREHVKEA